MFKSIKILIFCFCFSFSLDGLIFEIPSITDLPPYLRNESLVIVNVHSVLIEPAQMLGSEEWAEYELQNLKENEGMSYKEAMEELVPIWQRILLSSPMKCVEPTTMGMVRYLQKRGYKILGIDSQEVEMAYPTHFQLKALDIDMLRSAPYTGCTVVDLKPYAKYIDGILFIGNRGDFPLAITKFFECLKERPKHVIYIDTDTYRVASVADELNWKGIQTVGLRLTARDGKKSLYNPSVVEIQKRYQGKMLPDREAYWLVNHGFGDGH